MITFPVVLINTLSILMICAVIAVSWQRRADTCAAQLIIASALMLIWALGSFLEMAVGGLPLKILLRNITQIGVFGTPAAMMIFALSYTSYFKKHIRTISAVTYSIQTAGVLLVATDEWHHLIRDGVEIIKSGQYEVLVVKSTTIARVLISLNFFYMIVALILLIVFLFSDSSRELKKQAVYIFIGMGIAVVYSLMKVASNEMFGILVPISGIFALGDVFMLLGIIRYDFLMLAPLARNELFNVVGDGLIIASRNGKIVDFNRTASEIFCFGTESDSTEVRQIGERIDVLFPNWQGTVTCCQATKLMFSIVKSGTKNYYLCETYPVFSGKTAIGSVSLIKNITEQKKSTDLLKERAEKDGLTGVYNRETFISLVEKSLSETNDEVCFLYMDADFFKEVNDRYGHIFGDYVLAEICRLLKAYFKGETLIGRMGGEEFAVFLKIDRQDQPSKVADEIRRIISEHQFVYNSTNVHITVSVGGVFGHFRNFDELYRVADDNLYKAKEAGRNTTYFKYLNP